VDNRQNIMRSTLFVIALFLTNTSALKIEQGVATDIMQFMEHQTLNAVENYVVEQQQSHNCNYNVDRLKKGPVDWTKIEGTGKIFTDHSFPADQTMLSWKEYPRSIGGLAKYLSWFKDFRRPKDLLNMSAKTQEHPEVSLFGKNNTLVTSDIEQGTLGDNYFLTVALAIAEHNPDIIRNVFSQ